VLSGGINSPFANVGTRKRLIPTTTLILEALHQEMMNWVMHDFC
jgi:hypothetical protein